MKNAHCEAPPNRPQRASGVAGRAPGSIGVLFLTCATLAALPLLDAPPAGLAWAAPAANEPAPQGPVSNLALGGVREFRLPQSASYKIIVGNDLVKAAVSDDVLRLTSLRPGRVLLAISAPEQTTQHYVVRIVSSAQVTPALAPSTQASAPTSGAAPAPEAPTPAPAPSTETPPTLPPLAGTDTTDNGTSGNGTAGTATPGLPAALTPPAALPPLEAPAQVSPPSLPPSQLPAGEPPFPMQPHLNGPALSAVNNPQIPKNAIVVTQGLARFLQFRSNILAVYFSDLNVMDARAVNARTIAVSGLAPGRSTLAVFTSRFEGDAIGRANIYQLVVEPKVSGIVVLNPQDPDAAAASIRAALNDPRIQVTVLKLPDGSLAATLRGTLRNDAEIKAAVATASLFVPQVISGLYVDANAPLPGAEPTPVPPTAEETLASKLQQLTGNPSIRLVSLPNGLALQAEVDSAAEAEGLLALLPQLDLNQRIIPLLVVHGAAAPGASPYYQAQYPLLTGEDARITRAMQDVTGIRSVYAMKTATNAIAIYGTVRNRTEYETVRRYAILLPQNGGQAFSNVEKLTIPGETDSRDPNRANSPLTGSRIPPQIQMFVKILDPNGSTVRVVTTESSVVEINRTALRNLGVEVGSVSLLTQTVTPGTPFSRTIDKDTGTVTSETAGTPPIIQRTINPAFNNGTLLGGNGLVGLEGFQNIDPIRVRLNALFQKGNARVLSQPNVTALEGNWAQITVGGSRPIPSSAISGTGGAAVETVDFRRFGIILTMRPTVTDDDTIIMQIRADVTDLDPTTAINLNGAIIPGETVRSVETVLTLREGDTIVMGGLITNTHRVQTSRVPVLSKLPIIGELFKSKRFENNESELAIFMTPRISRLPVSPWTYAAAGATPSMAPLPGNESGKDIFQAFGAAGGK